MQSNRTTQALPLLSSSFSSLIFALLPKCPACLVLLLAPFGIKVPGSNLFLIYMILMLAGIPLAFFWTPACRRCGTRPLFLALAGLAIMTVGRITFESNVIMAAGAAVLFAAAIWTARLSSASGRAIGASCKATASCASRI